jgi:hypothetical protein
VTVAFSSSFSHTGHLRLMAAGLQLGSLLNPLATVEQLSNSASRLDGVSTDLENSTRLSGALLTQAAGVLLKLPQEIAAQAVVLFARFYTGSEGGSFRIHSVKVGSGWELGGAGAPSSCC